PAVMPCQRALNSPESAGSVLRKFAVGGLKYSACDLVKLLNSSPDWHDKDCSFMKFVARLMAAPAHRRSEKNQGRFNVGS
ncbi:MAG TPA: hypothetical protein VJ889_08140, partial [Pseudomonas sp.]|nr:hypothetical protein [Pseudomonas sp.]